MLSVAEGVGIVTENLYPGRFRYVEELQRLGADIRTDGHHAVVRGRPSLRGARSCPRHPRRRRAGGRRTGRRRVDDDQRRAPHRPGLRRSGRPAGRGRRRHRTRRRVNAGRRSARSPRPLGEPAAAPTTTSIGPTISASSHPPWCAITLVTGGQRTDRGRIGHAGGMPGDERDRRRHDPRLGSRRRCAGRAGRARRERHGSMSPAAGSWAPTSCSSTCVTTCRGRPASCTATTTSSRSAGSVRRGGGGVRCPSRARRGHPLAENRYAPTSTGSA